MRRSRVAPLLLTAVLTVGSPMLATCDGGEDGDDDQQEQEQDDGGGDDEDD